MTGAEEDWGGGGGFDTDMEGAIACWGGGVGGLLGGGGLPGVGAGGGFLSDPTGGIGMFSADDLGSVRGGSP
jgi:hypothetical protein